MGNATITFPMFGDLALDLSRYFTVFGFKVYYYGAIIGVGFLLAVIYVMRRAEQFNLTQDNIVDMLLFAVPMAIVFARLFYVLFDPVGLSHYLESPSRIFAIRSGGLAIYGAIIGAALGAFICARWRKVRFGDYADIGGLGLLIGQAVGRWGNFVNREVYGRETTVPWRMGLTTEAGTIYVHPTFFYEFLWNLLGFVLLHLYSKRRGRKFSGQIFTFYLAWYGLGRAVIEGIRDPGQNLYLFSTDILVNRLLAILCVVGAVVFNIIMLRRPAAQLAGDAPAETVEEAAPEAEETETGDKEE